MRFRSKRMMEYEYAALEDEMLRTINNLLYESNLDEDGVRVRFAEMYGDENMHFLEEVLNES